VSLTCWADEAAGAHRIIGPALDATYGLGVIRRSTEPRRRQQSRGAEVLVEISPRAGRDIAEATAYFGVPPT